MQETPETLLEETSDLLDALIPVHCLRFFRPLPKGRL